MILPGDRSDREMVQDQCGHRLSFKLTPATEYFFVVSDIRSLKNEHVSVAIKATIII